MTAVKAGSRRSPTADFFDGLGSRGHEPLLKSESGTIRFDLLDGEKVEHWSVTMAKGSVSVSRRQGHADAVVRLPRETFDGMVSGSVNATAATQATRHAPTADVL